MPHDVPLIATIAAVVLSAWLLGSLARWIGLAPIVGYLLAGVVIGPTLPASSPTPPWPRSSRKSASSC